jgi:hypothetical protein
MQGKWYGLVVGRSQSALGGSGDRVFKGCEELLESTNQRRERGAERLFLRIFNDSSR